ncbi:hypothetical protein [Aquabacterium sp.]|uniref:hypothetical protein n=1 Tax=Aquabacterium sp. TaxID=1872578 RepID=UPI002CDBC552|nr:hypothetical protein [Aquabacterium sp.]HSW05907.1 hypothetical protein [Aquabacterium sp.]
MAGPLPKAQGVRCADIDLERVGIAQRSLDVVGHYTRPDLFRLQVNTAPARPVNVNQE